jgi:phage recombination protein Bet
LDILQKPVYPVPMSFQNEKTKEYEFRDVVMPGIGLYRIQAARTNQYAGLSEPEYGEEVEGTFKDKKDGDIQVIYPKWCKITVRKIIQNTIVDFVAKEFWLENYARKNKFFTAPNDMWLKRPYAQLAKCTEAQGLRKAFPDKVDQQPTAEEMEGKTFEEYERAMKNINPNLKTQTLNSRLDDLIKDQGSNQSERDKLLQLVKTHEVSPETVKAWCEKAEVPGLDMLEDNKIINSLINHIEEKYITKEIS